MMTPIFTRIDFQERACPNLGSVHWSPLKSIWWTGMLGFWLFAGTFFFSWSAVFVFLGLTGVTLCLGHSIGMHRKLIHRSFESPAWVEGVLVYLGTLVGLGGPFTMMLNHDMRDWAQRSPNCHPFLSHQSGFFKDFWWQLHCKLQLKRPPSFTYPKEMASNGFYKFLQSTSILQQVLLALLLLSVGTFFGGLAEGIAWVAWGVAGRVTISIFGHWLIGYFAHNAGQRNFEVRGAAVQGFNISWAGWVTFGEAWHNNHHAYPDSARMGLKAAEFDPGWAVLKILERMGLVWALKEPEDLDERPELFDFFCDQEVFWRGWEHVYRKPRS